MQRTGVVFVGCGYVADSYRQCLDLHEELRLVGVYDRDPQRLSAFAGYWGERAYRSLDEALAEPDAQIVVNLTSVDSHFEVTRAARRGARGGAADRGRAVQRAGRERADAMEGRARGPDRRAAPRLRRA